MGAGGPAGGRGEPGSSSREGRPVEAPVVCTDPRTRAHAHPSERSSELVRLWIPALRLRCVAGTGGAPASTVAPPPASLGLQHLLSAAASLRPVRQEACGRGRGVGGFEGPLSSEASRVRAREARPSRGQLLVTAEVLRLEACAGPAGLPWFGCLAPRFTLQTGTSIVMGGRVFSDARKPLSIMLARVLAVLRIKDNKTRFLTWV